MSEHTVMIDPDAAALKAAASTVERAQTTRGMAMVLARAKWVLGSKKRTSTASSVANDLVNVTSGITEHLTLYDFYSLYVLSICKGNFVSVPTAAAHQSDVFQNVTSCSQTTWANFLDPKSVLQQEFGSIGAEFVDFTWLEQITNRLDTLQWAYRGTVVLYFIAIGFMFMAIAVATTNICCSCCGFGYFILYVAECLALGALSLVAIFVTHGAIQSTSIINAYGKVAGIEATVGTKFLLLTWGACILLSTAVLLKQ